MSFYGRKLRIFVISQSVCPGKLFQLSLMIVGKVGPYHIEEPFSCSTIRQVPGLTLKQQTRLERPLRDKHSSLLQTFFNYGQPSLMFVGKAVPYLIEEPFRCSTLGQVPGLTHKHQARLDRLARDKHSSLLQTFFSYGNNIFLTLSPGANVINIFTAISYKFL